MLCQFTILIPEILLIWELFLLRQRLSRWQSILRVKVLLVVQALLILRMLHRILVSIRLCRYGGLLVRVEAKVTDPLVLPVLEVFRDWLLFTLLLFPMMFREHLWLIHVDFCRLSHGSICSGSVTRLLQRRMFSRRFWRSGYSDLSAVMRILIIVVVFVGLIEGRRLRQVHIHDFILIFRGAEWLESALACVFLDVDRRGDVCSLRPHRLLAMVEARLISLEIVSSLTRYFRV